MSIRVASFYQFTALPDHAVLQPPLRSFCAGHGLRGTVLLAPEGINGTIAGSAGAVAELIEALRAGAFGAPAFNQLKLKFSAAQKQPFQRLKIRLKREIVALGQPHADPRITVGTYVQPEDWNAVLADRATFLIDTRNDFEVEMGSFQGAVNPHIARFSDFAEFARKNLDPDKHQRIAMFCTGGIRCEKASAFLLAEGFAEVLHLQGGILNYLERIPAKQSRWLGECFVFDERITLSHSNFGDPE
jgi:UPF0176 protein